MAKIQFDIKYRDKIESGEYKVVAHEHEEQDARIVCWDNKGEYPIVALIDNEPEKFDKHGRVPGGNRGGEFSLFIVTPEPELSEFEKAVDAIYESCNVKELRVKDKAAELLDLAKKELCESGEVTDWYAKGKAEALREIEQDPESSYAFKRGVEYGKEEALKDLPRWVKVNDGDLLDKYSRYLLCTNEGYYFCWGTHITRDGYMLLVDNLKKLPKGEQE